MKSFLLAAGAILAMFSLIPLSAWAARGRWRDAWEAAKGYLLVMFWLVVVPGIAGVVWSLLSFAAE